MTARNIDSVSDGIEADLALIFTLIMFEGRQVLGGFRLRSIGVQLLLFLSRVEVVIIRLIFVACRLHICHPELVDIASVLDVVND